MDAVAGIRDCVVMTENKFKKIILEMACFFVKV